MPSPLALLESRWIDGDFKFTLDASHASFYYNFPFYGISNPTDGYASYAEHAMTAWSSVSNITFTLDNEDPDIGFYEATFPTPDPEDPNDGPHPGHTDKAVIAGYVVSDSDIYVNKDSAAFTISGEKAFTYLHELGHALGLQEPNGNGEDSDYKQNMTVMSYRNFWVPPSTPMYFDIRAIQEMYGIKDTEANNISIDHNNITLDGSAKLFTIWDGGGIDTLDTSSSQTHDKIDLRDKSEVINGELDHGSQVGQSFFWVAFGANIENVNAGSGNDIINGNDPFEGTFHGFTEYPEFNGANELHGNGGNDKIYGHGGDDKLYGGAATDQLYGGFGNDILDGGTGNDVLIGEDGEDTYLLHSTNNGLTTIVDDTGTLKVNDAAFSGNAARIGETKTWDMGDYTAKFKFGTQDLLLTNDTNSANQFLLKDFQNGDYGITLKQGDSTTDSGVTLTDTAWLLYKTSYEIVTYSGRDTEIGAARLAYSEAHSVPPENPLTYGLKLLAGSNSVLDVTGYVNEPGPLPGGINIPIYSAIDAVIYKTVVDIVTTPGFWPNGEYGAVSFVLEDSDQFDGYEYAEYRWEPVSYSTSGLASILDLNGDGMDDRGLFASLGTTGTDQNDILFGTDSSEVMTGGMGQDVLYFAEDFGNDTVEGGEAIYIDGSTADGYAQFDAAAQSLVLGDVKLTQSVEGLLLSKGANSILLADWNADTNNYNITLGEVPALTFGTEGADTLTGDTGADYIYGGAGNDLLIATDGSDYLSGGEGNDTVSYSDVMGGVSVDLLNGSAYKYSGSDTLAGIENIVGTDYWMGDQLRGNDDANLILGGGGDDRLYGNGGDDTLDGGGDQNQFYGGDGADTFIVNGNGFQNVIFDFDTSVAGEKILLQGFTQSIDFANLAIADGWGGATLTLDGNKTLVLYGVSAAELTAAHFGQTATPGQTFTGTVGNDSLVGGSGNDTLDGGAGADTLAGGAGNDTYYVGAGDTIVEGASAGIDTVISGGSYVLGANLENLTITGTGNFTGTGNALDNIITGNAGTNQLSGNGGNDTLIGGDGGDIIQGGAGADSMAGGLGNDYYYVDDAGDTVTENGGEGTDRVYSSIDFTLGSEVEALFLTGSGNLDGTGNALANHLGGNSGNNILTGDAGNDTFAGAAGNDTLYGGDGNDMLQGEAGDDLMAGGAGNDNYYVNETGDSVIEYASEGVDRVYSTVDFTLGSEVDYLFLIGSGNQNGTGNALANHLGGNSANNILVGAAGNDTLQGAAGDDTLVGGSGVDQLYGGTGADAFVYTANSHSGIGSGARDIILDFNAAEGDKIDLSGFAGTFNFVGTGAFTGTAGEVNYSISGSNTILAIDSDGNGVADFQIQLTGAHTLTANDFLL